jgi:heat-inducible transcriptional repressor
VTPELGYRARKILYAAITEYIATGEPVGSRTLARRYGLALSPATIRNELSDLEEAGFLAQPHTSAGRVPTDRGFRTFVDALVQIREVTSEDRSAVVARMHALRPGVDDVMREAGRLLSSLTGAAAVVVTPRPDEERLAQLRFMPLAPGELLAVLITRSGTVQNRVVRVGRDLDAQELERAHNYLAELLAVGRSLEELRHAIAEQMATERGRYDIEKRRVKELVDAAATRTRDDAREGVIVEGQGLLLDRPEFADVEKLRALVRTFEDKERLLELLDRTLGSGGLQVVIGKETQLGAGGDELSVVSATYRQAGHASGTVGVIGPTRMDYAKIVPLVGFTARVVGELLDGIEPGRSGERTR